MAMVLDAFASYVGHLLTQVAADEVEMLLGVSGEIDKMGDKLQDLKKFLADADRRNITDEIVQEWVGQLKRAMYEAADILDLCQLKAMERGPSSSVDAGCFNPLLFCLRNPTHAHDIATRIKALNQRLDTIQERSASFSFIDLRSYGDRRSSTVHDSHNDNPSRETIGDFDRSAVVGQKIKEDTRALVYQIMKPPEDASGNNMVVAIVGVGGIGKTTLAQKIFSDEAIQDEFSKKLWLSVNQSFSDVELLRRAIIEAGGDAPPHGSARNTLHETLKKALNGHKTFLVMDDVWDHGAWERVMKIPLVNAAASGSQVLITTRNEGVARAMTARWPFHQVDLLASDDAWSLLKKQVLSGDIEEDRINMLKDIGLKIIKKCGYLPLAVKLMGGLLRERRGIRREWEQVLDDSKWSTTQMPQELSNALYLSYADMPSYMKQCFLYYSLLPKNRKFYFYEVIAMWISEGFIHGTSNDLEESGRTCYDELVSRNLIEPNKSYIDLVVCSMHDVVRSFAHYMTRDEALIAHNAEVNILTELNTNKFIRLSIETNLLQSDELDWKSFKEQRSVRTLISTIQIKMNHIDLLARFSSLRTLHIEYADVAALVELLHELKHLRYLALMHTNISILPVSIGKIKLLQSFILEGCKNLMNLPDSIVQLGQLRALCLTYESKIPRVFHGLTSMRRLTGFQAHMDGDWCSLDELGPLSQLRFLHLVKLESVSVASFAANARLGEKIHLIELHLSCTSKLGHNGLVKEKEGVSKEEQQRIEKLFDELCPPPSVENLHILGYFGKQLPSWMMPTSTVPLNNIKNLVFSDLACCTQLPNGLCQLPYLQLLHVARAPCIRRVGAGFLQAATTPFPRLNKMFLSEMLEWEEWEWEEQVQAMPCLEELLLKDCKLRWFPTGLSLHAKALKVLYIRSVQYLSHLENFPFVTKLTVVSSPNLDRITNLPNLQKLTIIDCPMLKVLERIPALERLVLIDYNMETLPEYMRYITPRHLELSCRLWLLASLADRQSGTEWDKFSHVEDVKAYAGDENIRRKWYVLYTRDNCKLDSNISRPAVFEETLSSCMVDAQGFEHVYKMRRNTFSYVCSLVRVPLLEDMMARDHTFADGRVLSLQDRVAVALRMLRSGEPLEIVGSSVGVNKPTVLLVTQMFVNAMRARARHHLAWPAGSNIMEKIKRKFDKIHGLPNCCGVLHTIHINFGSEDRDHEENDGELMQVVFGPTMRFTNIWLGPSASMNQWNIFHESELFKFCQKGTWLNGSKLNVSAGGGSQVGEYIIGDAGYKLLPWLLTPYHLEDKELSADFPPYQAEFNKRHSLASTRTLAVLARLKDTWKILGREMGRLPSYCPLQRIIYACCKLHNIVLDVEEWRDTVNYINQVRTPADEDAVRIRDALSQHFIESGETLSSSMLEAQITKVGRYTFTYICSLVRDHTIFVEGRVMSLQDQVAIALRMLNSGEPLVTVGSSLGVNESTVLLVTQGFVEAMWEQAMHHLHWPGSAKMEKIKRKFDKIHGLPNCCGVVHTSHIKFGSEYGDHEQNDGMLIQIVVGPDMRFTNIWLGPSASMNHSSILHESRLFKECQKGTWLNGSRLNVSAGGGSEVGEYIIGDQRHSLLPWLLTPYHLEDKEITAVFPPYQAEFNRRHSLASTIPLAALERLKDTWKILDREMWRSLSSCTLYQIIYVCCMLHNIEMEEEEGAPMLRYQEVNFSQEVRQLAGEDAVMVRDILSHHMMESGVHTMAAEEQQEVATAASNSGDENTEDQ